MTTAPPARAPVMPDARRTAIRGVNLCVALGLSRNRAALVVMHACAVATADIIGQGSVNVTWLTEVREHARRIAWRETVPPRPQVRGSHDT